MKNGSDQSGAVEGSVEIHRCSSGWVRGSRETRIMFSSEANLDEITNGSSPSV